MKLRVWVALILAFSLGIPGAGSAAPDQAIVDLPDTPLTSPNVHWVTTVHTGASPGGKFATIDGKLYYFASTVRAGFFLPSGVGSSGVIALDASNPEQPVPVGHFPIPYASQNEDVDLSANRKLLLYSMDNAAINSTVCGATATATALTRNTPAQVLNGTIDSPQNRAALCRRRGGILFVFDISNPRAITPISILLYPEVLGWRQNGTPLSGPGHTASCILDCNYVYVAGGRNRGAMVVDLRDPAAPAIIGTVTSPAGADGNGYAPGVLHDVHTDRYGNVWMVGSGGSAMYAPIKNPLKPVLLAAVSRADNASHNGLIHHGALRLDKNTVLIGEEDFATGDCGAADGTGPQDGSLQTWTIDSKAKRLRHQDSWDAELATEYQSALAVAGISCTSHWFDVNANRVVADAFYEQGVRFLNASNPKDLRQVGYWIPPAGAASQALFVPGRPDLVYVADYARGLDVLRIDDGGKGAAPVKAPVRAEWFKDYQGISFVRPMTKDETYGWACKRPALL